MMYLLIVGAIALSGCSASPLVDLRASEDVAQYYQRDLWECERLIKKNRHWLNKPLLGVDPMLNDCLEGRGHNVLQ